MSAESDAVVLGALEDIAAKQTLHSDALVRIEDALAAQLARINDIAADVEDGLRKQGIFLYIRRHPDPDDG